MAAAADPERKIPCPFYLNYPKHPLMPITMNGQRHFEDCHMAKMLEKMQAGENVDAMVRKCKYNPKHVYLPEGLPIHERYFCQDFKEGFDWKVHVTNPNTKYSNGYPPYMTKQERRAWEIKRGEEMEAERKKKEEEEEKQKTLEKKSKIRTGLCNCLFRGKR